jgi:hypothetical protein
VTARVEEAFTAPVGESAVTVVVARVLVPVTKRVPLTVMLPVVDDPTVKFCMNAFVEVLFVVVAFNATRLVVEAFVAANVVEVAVVAKRDVMKAFVVVAFVRKVSVRVEVEAEKKEL